MWLHIRGVGEWTNTLYSYFEREQERLHNGEVLPYIASSSSKANTLESKAPLTNTTPQMDFLNRNLARFDHSRTIDELHESLSGEDSPAMMHSENEQQKSDTNPFVFAGKSAQPKRPPRSGQNTPRKLSQDNTPKTPTATSPPKLGRQMSESASPIRKIQATLQRTFSRKSSNPQDGYSNDGFISDDSKEMASLAKRKTLPDKKQSAALSKSKAPLEKSLSMPDMENRLKKRERLIA